MGNLYRVFEYEGELFAAECHNTGFELQKKGEGGRYHPLTTKAPLELLKMAAKQFTRYLEGREKAQKAIRKQGGLNAFNF